MPKIKFTKEQQDRLVFFALKHLGKPYVYGAKSSTAPKNFDCSSFVQYLYKRIGVKLPRTTINQVDVGEPVKNIEKLEVGDLVFLHGTVGRYNHEFPQGIGHVAMYIGNGEVVHAAGSSRGDKVVREKLRSVIADYKLVAMRRYSHRLKQKVVHWSDR